MVKLLLPDREIQVRFPIIAGLGILFGGGGLEDMYWATTDCVICPGGSVIELRLPDREIRVCFIAWLCFLLGAEALEDMY